MARIVMLVCVAALLVWWELLLKLLHAASTRLARRHLDRYISSMARRLLGLARFYGGLTLEIDPTLARSAPNPALVCANHQSMADIAVLLAAMKHHRLRFVAKAELRRGWIAVSEVLRIQRHAFVDRSGTRRSTLDAIRRLAERSAAGLSPVVFPEGTRSRDGNLKRFHAGAIRTILEGTPLPIAAVAIDGGSRFHSMATLRRGLRGVRYRIGYAGTVEAAGSKGGVEAAVAKCREAIAVLLDSWRSTGGSDPGTTGH